MLVQVATSLERTLRNLRTGVPVTFDNGDGGSVPPNVHRAPWCAGERRPACHSVVRQALERRNAYGDLKVGFETSARKTNVASFPVRGWRCVCATLVAPRWR
ncbi:hypothetical protein TGVEG_440200 [Toxoplasma gondii VEG]|uniref:Uncharacterized protein n=1 Tax=Toxoplasma gondii (strain ATCC 50861 / VEG) TaxID=432359 RepID=V4ZL62_TOXGV|nr:hypothetical protein TGVEG_440200 [Toxoplasma gondii VEG]